MEKIVDVQFPFPRKLRKEMNIEPVAAVDDSNGRTAGYLYAAIFSESKKIGLSPYKRYVLPGGAAKCCTIV